jgi:hypothetical protein
VAVESGVVKYSRNGTVFYTSTVPPTYPLRVDTSLYSNGSTIMNVLIASNSGGGATSSDAYTQNFMYCALARQPYPDEASYWNDILRAAYTHGQGSPVMVARELGKTLFESAAYAARGRSNHDYVYDLYNAYLMRAPNASDWAYWESMVPAMGREGVRRAFDECAEFNNRVLSLTSSGAPSSGVTSLLSARVDPVNQPGSGMLARDAEWSLPLLSLPGRAGLDLGLSLSYSSMVWTRSGPYIYFDEDDSSLSPGFRLGFPTIQEKYFDAQVGVNAYLLITSSGNRVELRQLGASNVYEAADSSYLQLIDNGGSLLLSTALPHKCLKPLSCLKIILTYFVG